MTLNVLLLCDKPQLGRNANAIVDHIEAIENYSIHKIYLYSNLGDFSLKLDLNKFDVIIIHYSLSLLRSSHIPSKAKNQLREFNGLKVVLVQDEYQQINKMISQLQFLKIDILFTNFPEYEMRKIYSKTDLPNLSLYNNLTGYIPERILGKTVPLIKNRPCHVGYRSRKNPFWFGELAYEKWSIVEKWKAFGRQKDIKVNISYKEQDRIYGSKWLDFISSCKATLGVESGASVIDFTGELEKTVDLHQLSNPKDDFFTVQKLYLKEHEGKYKLNQISPRCFEAIALKTVLVLYEGEYSGILIPGRHYIPLKKDFSNIDEVINKLLDDDFLQNMADMAYHEIALDTRYSFRNYVGKMDEIIFNEFAQRMIRKVEIPYKKEQFDKVIRCIPLKKKMHLFALSVYYKLPFSTKLIVKAILRPKSTWQLFLIKFKSLGKKVGFTIR